MTKQTAMSALALHDELLLNKPEGASHDVELCLFCQDWSLMDDGVPSCFERLTEDQQVRPFGDVEYADEGEIGGVARWPIDTAAHATWSLGLITSPSTADKYTSEQLDAIKARIEQALEAPERQAEPEVHTVADDTLARETHEALLRKAVDDATAETTQRIAELEGQVASLTSERDEALERADAAEQENEKVNADLDQAQVELKTKVDRVTELEGEISSIKEESEKSEVAAQRATQVRNLGLFSDEYIEEKAARWADHSEEEFAELLESWKTVQTSQGGSKKTPTETASKMSGSSESGSEGGKGDDDPAATARQKLLGLAG